MKLAPRFVAFALVALLGCSKAPSEARPDPTPASAPAPTAAPAPIAAPPPAAAPPVAAPVETGVPANFPPACVAYAALIEKLKACDKVGAARDGLARGYHELRAAWAMVPPDQRAAVDAQCKTQADSLRNAAAAACSW
jgi:hypothetical protein